MIAWSVCESNSGLITRSRHWIERFDAVAALAADGPSTILNADAAGVSFPEFFDTLRQIAQ
jgi:5-enolpyruvylshikimate-3-phosphate synthase